MKNIRLLPILISLILCAFQCDDDFDSPMTSEPASIKIKIEPNISEVLVNDTIWLFGSATSWVYSFEMQDSILWEPYDIFIFFYRLKVPINSNDYNTTPAASEFSYFATIGSIAKEDYSWTFTPEAFAHWDNLHRIITPELTDDGNFYSMRVGVIPQSIGYFAFKCSNTFVVDNFHRDLYSQFDNGETYSFYAKNRYGSSWAAIDNSIYFFKVINGEEEN